MISTNFDNLIKSGQLKAEPADQQEFDGLLKSGKKRLHDASNELIIAVKTVLKSVTALKK